MEKNEKTEEPRRGKNSGKGDTHMQTMSLPECSSEYAAFPKESPMDQQIYLNTLIVSSESLESSNLNRNMLQSETIYIHEASNDLDAERTKSSELLKNKIRILTNKVKLLQSKLSKHREDKKKIKRVKRRLGKSVTVIYLESLYLNAYTCGSRCPVNHHLCLI